VPHSNQPQRIAFCITDLDHGGAEKALVEIVTRLDRQKWEPKVFCLSKPGVLVSELEAANIPVVCLGATSSRQFWVIFQLMREFRRFRPTVLQTFLFHANFIGRIVGWLTRVPIIVSGIRVAEKRYRSHLFLDRWTNWMVAKNICVSQAVADFTVNRAGLNSAKIDVIPNGVDSVRFSTAQPADLSEFDIPHDAQTILYVGRLDPQKDVNSLLVAFSQLSGRHAQLHLLLVGQGPSEGELRSYITTNNLSGKAHLVGWRDDVERLMQASFCFVLPSLWEGMANVVLEAMAAGLPVIATRVEGTTELINHQITGLLVDTGQPTEIANQVEFLLTHPSECSEFRKNSQKLTTKEFTWIKIAENYEKLYNSLL